MRRRLSTVLPTATAVVLAGFAGTGATPAATPDVRPAAYSSQHSVSQQLHRLDARAARNERRTRREARRLLALAPVPPDAAGTEAKQARLGPALGMVMTTSLIDDASHWDVPESFLGVWRYVRAHGPANLPVIGRAQGTIGGQPIRGIGWGEPDTSYAQYLQTEVTITPDGSGGTYLEADGGGAWLDPRPLPAYVGRHPIRVTVAGGCPRSDRGVTGVLNPGQPELRFNLVPRRAPSAALVCTYAGGSSRPAFGLVHRTLLDRRHARALADRTRALDVAHLDGGWSSCPAYFGDASIVVLAYRHVPDVDLVTAGGCGGTSNGRIWVWGTPL